MNIEKVVRALSSQSTKKQLVNYEGRPAYERPLKERVVQVLVTGTLGDTFYASSQTMAKEALEVLTRARQECPEFLAKAIVFARNRGFMKTLPILALVVLGAGRTSREKQLFETVFPQVILTPDDARAFVALAKSGVVPGRSGLGGIALKSTKMWLTGLSEYHALKYGSSASRGITLGDMIRLAHPRPASEATAERYRWLLSGNMSALGSNPALNPQILALECLKQTTTESEALFLIRTGRLPYEVVVPTLQQTTPAIWAELLRQAPYFNLLRTLATFQRHGVFADEANVRYAAERLTDSRAIGRSKLLPFRFFAAWQQYTALENFDSRIADALREALEKSFAALPSLGRRSIAIGTDVSGSMNGQISERSSMSFVDVAGIFTGALLKRCEDRVLVFPFDTEVHTDGQFSTRDDIMVTAEKIRLLCGGGTAVGAPIQYLLENKIQVDAFIGITDNEDWTYGNGFVCRGSFLELWKKYTARVAPHAKAYLVTIAPYRHAVAPAGSKGVRYIYGWSDSVIGYIGSDLDSGLGQIQQIETMSIAAETLNPHVEADQTESDSEDAQ